MPKPYEHMAETSETVLTEAEEFLTEEAAGSWQQSVQRDRMAAIALEKDFFYKKNRSSKAMASGRSWRH